MTHTVFVYGSLMSGMYNNRLLEGATPLGKDQTAGLYQMRDLGVFPAVVCPGPVDHCCPIKGEAYEVDDKMLARLDRLEGHPEMYLRCPVKLESGRLAFMYVWQHQPRGGVVVGGDWRAHCERLNKTMS